MTERFEALRSGSDARRAELGLAQRRAALKSLSQVLVRRRAEIIAALATDLGKAPDETELTEIMPTLSEIAHSRSHLRGWMRPRRVWPTLLMVGTSARVLPQPKGVALVIAPWNYPLLLALGPLVSALAAGNAVVLKPSEMTPATSALLVHICAEAFAADLVQVVQGGAEVAGALLDLPFDHVFFTGSPGVGRIVLAATAKNLTPVTLELGGKSPVVIGPDADLTRAARWIAWGKVLNAGQICVSPDHVFVPRALLPQLTETLKGHIAKSYGSDAGASPDLCQIVNSRHYARLSAHLSDAEAKGAQILTLGRDEPGRNLMAPRLVLGSTPQMTLLQDEIFGPILPLIPYDDLTEPIARINAGPKPLTLYIFAKDRGFVRRVGAQTQSGSVGVNLTVMPFVHNNFGFGGIGQSGMGAGHGKVGFDTFSHLKPVMRNQFSLLTLLFPPYGARTRNLLRVLLAYLR